MSSFANAPLPSEHGAGRTARFAASHETPVVSLNEVIRKGVGDSKTRSGRPSGILRTVRRKNHTTLKNLRDV